MSEEKYYYYRVHFPAERSPYSGATSREHPDARGYQIDGDNMLELVDDEQITVAVYAPGTWLSFERVEDLSGDD